MVASCREGLNFAFAPCVRLAVGQKRTWAEHIPAVFGPTSVTERSGPLSPNRGVGGEPEAHPDADLYHRAGPGDTRTGGRRGRCKGQLRRSFR